MPLIGISVSVGIVILTMMAGRVAGEPLTFEVAVDGLQCPFCAFGVERELSRIAGVENVEVILEENVIILSLAEDTSLNETDRAATIAAAQLAIGQAVDKAGFTLRAVELITSSR